MSDSEQQVNGGSVTRGRLLVLQRHFVILGVALADVERPPLDDRQLCGLTIMRWPLATA